MKKYNRTFHFSFSMEIHSDDKTLDPIAEKNNFINTTVVITEKIDGSNACLRNKTVYGRTHSVPANHRSFSMLKQINSYLISQNRIPQDMLIFGENMQAIHSIDYGELTAVFYIFNVKKGDTWLSWPEVEEIARRLHLPTVPVVFIGQFKSIDQLEKFLKEEIKKPSMISKNGAPKEGFVVRPYEQFEDKDFAKRVGKFVRKGHVQSPEHWSSNWKEAKISNDFWTHF